MPCSKPSVAVGGKSGPAAVPVNGNTLLVHSASFSMVSRLGQVVADRQSKRKGGPQSQVQLQPSSCAIFLCFQ